MSQATLLSTSPSTSSFPPIAYKGTPAMTTEMLAQAYGVESVRIRQNFSRNTARFLEGKHFFVISGNELKELKHCVSLSDSVNIPHQTRKLTLWTDRGAARHAKMLETDTAWDVYEMLEDTFFKLDKLAAEEQSALAGDVNPFSLSPAQQAHIHAIVSAKVGMLPIEVHRKAYSEIWTRFGRHFQIAKYQQLPPARMGEAVEYLVGMEVTAAKRALPPAPHDPLHVERLQLTPWDKVQLGKQTVEILERCGKVGPRTLECILLKLRYFDAIQDVLKLGNNLAADINKVRAGVFGKIVQAGNVTGCPTDSVMDTLCDDTYRLQSMARDFELAAFRALNASICGAKMQGV